VCVDRDRDRDGFSLVMRLDVKQGRVEVDMEQMMDDAFDAGTKVLALLVQKYTY
jgi:hypothetical protein